VEKLNRFKKKRWTRIISLLEFYRDELSEKFDIFNGSDSNQINKVRKLLFNCACELFPDSWDNTKVGYVDHVIYLLKYLRPEKIDELISDYYKNLQLEIEHEEKLKLIP